MNWRHRQEGRVGNDVGVHTDLGHGGGVERELVQGRLGVERRGDPLLRADHPWDGRHSTQLRAQHRIPVHRRRQGRQYVSFLGPIHIMRKRKISNNKQKWSKKISFSLLFSLVVNRPLHDTLRPIYTKWKREWEPKGKRTSKEKR